MIDALLVLLVAACLTLAAIRPWLGLALLLGLLPLNGFLVLVVADMLALSDLQRIALAAWHDAVVAGVVIAAAISLQRQPPRWPFRARGVETLAAVVLGLGAIYVLVAPFKLTALYGYRTLYEPIILALALIALARSRGLPAAVGGRVSRALVAGGVVAALAAWPQVYLGGFAYLDAFYHDPGDRLSPSYLATGLGQPRAVGTFNSPNEFAAYLAIVIAVLVLPRLTGLPSRARAWLLVPTVVALLLTFSRSGWLATGVMLAVGAFLVWQQDGRPSPRRTLSDASRRLRRLWPQLAAATALLLVVVVSSRAPVFIESTLSGEDPSAGARPASAEQGVKVIRANPLGVGLGMAGPKSTRFGEVGDTPVLASETWYIAYAMQVGIFGLGAILLLVLAVARELARPPRGPWATLGLAIGAGLATGALFIPIIDDPAVATPLWAIIGIGLASARAGGVAEADARPLEPAGP